MKSHITFACLAALLTWNAVPTPTASACGGFFCSRTPVDQGAERILFNINADGTTEMVVQISYEGLEEDFAWVLPVGSVPQNRDVFPQAALDALDVGTEPIFQMHPECQGPEIQFDAAFAPNASAGGAGGDPSAEPDVIVHVMEEVGAYEVSVIESDDPAATAKWLRDHEYNIADSMDPYIKLYTELGQKFLALRLTADASVSDIEPFRMTLPGKAPSVPLRLTTIAAEPEMGILVWIFADQRYAPANAKELEIDHEQLRWEPYSYGRTNNWKALIARAVDRVDGQGWVAEMAGDATEIRTQIETTPTFVEGAEEARDALLDVIGDSSYLTRLYTRLAPAEMTYDPIFRRSDAEDVDRVHQLPYVEALCTADMPEPVPPTPCDYAACGALGLCVDVKNPDSELEEAACACAPGATARTTFGPSGQPTISCIDQRMSFMNVGEKDVRGLKLPDNCVGFECGDHGRCVSMNLTPTCECDEGYVARGWIEDGQRRAICMISPDEIPESFYNRRPAVRSEALPVGRDVEIPDARGESDVELGMAENPAVPDPDAPVGSAGASDEDGASSSGGCSVAHGQTAGRSGLTAGASLWILGSLGLWLRRRQRLTRTCA